MTLYPVTVPKWGLAMEEATLANWLVPEGTIVAPGDEIAEVETSKIANVLEAPVKGVLRRHVAVAGEVKALGALLAVIADAEENDAAIDAFVADHEAGFVQDEQPDGAARQAETVIVDDHPFRFLRIAREGEAQLRPVVLIHGFGGDHLNWMFNQAALAAHRPVYAIDLPGHGGTSKDVGDGSLDALAARVSAWMAQQGRGAVHVVGHSMGAAVAATIALNEPEKVRSLTAICGAGFGGTLNTEYIEGYIDAQRRKDLKPVVELLFANPGLVTREMLDDLIAAKRIDGAAQALRMIAHNALGRASLMNIATRLSEIRSPMFKVCGAQDKILPIAADSATAGDTLVIERAGHMPHLEAAEIVNSRIAGFLEQSD